MEDRLAGLEAEKEHLMQLGLSPDEHQNNKGDVFERVEMITAEIQALQDALHKGQVAYSAARVHCRTMEDRLAGLEAERKQLTQLGLSPDEHKNSKDGVFERVEMITAEILALQDALHKGQVAYSAARVHCR